MRFMFIVCLFVALIGLAGCGKSQQQIEADEIQREAQANEQSLKERMRGYQDQLLNSSKDPASAQLRNLRLVNGEGGEAHGTALA